MTQKKSKPNKSMILSEMKEEIQLIRVQVIRLELLLGLIASLINDPYNQKLYAAIMNEMHTHCKNEFEQITSTG